MGKKDKTKKNKPLEITDELALSAARVLKGYCLDKKNCVGCVIDNNIHTNGCGVGFPCTWNLPERSKKNGTSD